MSDESHEPASSDDEKESGGKYDKYIDRLLDLLDILTS